MKRGSFILIIVALIFSLNIPISKSLVITGHDIKELDTNLSVSGAPPSLNLIEPENITYSTNVSVPLTFAFDSSVESIWYRVDNGVNITITSSTSFNTSFGSHNLSLYANNSAGTTEKNVTFFISETEDPPVIEDDDEEKKDGSFPPSDPEGEDSGDDGSTGDDEGDRSAEDGCGPWDDKCIANYKTQTVVGNKIIMKGMQSRVCIINGVERIERRECSLQQKININNPGGSPKKKQLEILDDEGSIVSKLNLNQDSSDSTINQKLDIQITLEGRYPKHKFYTEDKDIKWWWLRIGNIWAYLFSLLILILLYLIYRLTKRYYKEKHAKLSKKSQTEILSRLNPKINNYELKELD